ncbi:MAG: hypothetical protein V8S26_06590 [Lachnospiraceae bacterium]
MPHGFYEHGFGTYTEAEMGFISEQERRGVPDGRSAQGFRGMFTLYQTTFPVMI